MDCQKNLAMNLFGMIYKRLSRLIYALISFSPFLTKVFTTMRREGMLLIVRYILPNPTNIEGHILFYHKGDADTIVPLSLGTYEPEVKKTFLQFLRPGMTMIDVGANIGYYTLLAARAVEQSGHVYAFEPMPTTVALLRKNVEENGYSDRVTIVPKAVADKSSQVCIYLNKETPGASSMFWGHEKDVVWVESTSLDEFFAKQAWPPSILSRWISRGQRGLH